MRTLRVWFEKLSPQVAAAVCLALVASFATLDRIAPRQITFTLFYALVAALAGWAGGTKVGAVIAIASAIAAGVDERIHFGNGGPLWILCWNSAARLAVYLVISRLAAAIRELTGTLEQRVSRRTAELEAEVRHRKQTEAQLQESALRFRQLAESINAVFWMNDPETRQILYVSPAYEKVWGRPCQSLLDSPQSWRETIHIEDRPRVLEDILAKQLSGEYDEEYRVVRPGGDVRWVRDRAFPIRDDTGAVLRIAGIAEDITERKLALEALRDSETRYRSLVETAQDVIFTISSDGTIGSLNAAFEGLTGWRREEWVGRPFAHIIHPDDLLLIVEMFGQVLKGAKTPVFEMRARTKSGGYLVAQASATPQIKDGNVIGALGIARDITVRKRLEKEILEVSDREQARIGQDIHDGLCQQLVSAAFDCNRLSEQLAVKSPPQAALAEQLSSLVDGAISEARAVARGLFPVQLESDGLASALQELAANTGARAKVCCRIECSEAVAVSDNAVATHLYRIAQEAVNNAVKHGRAHTVTIRLGASAGQIYLAVADDGIGMSSGPNPSRGMGLHIMDYRARTIGGLLKIDPAPDGGTVVSCCAPLPTS